MSLNICTEKLLNFIELNVRRIAVIFLLITSFFLIYSIFLFFTKSSLSTLYAMIIGFSFFGFFGTLRFLIKESIFLKINDNFEEYSIHIKSFFRSKFKIFDILYVVTSIIILFIIETSLYTKPHLYYYLVSFVAVLIALEISCCDEKRMSKFFCIKILLKIFALSIIVSYSSLIINPSLLGIDNLYHYSNIVTVIKTGQIDQAFFHYFYFPSFYFLYSTLGLINDISIQNFNLFNVILSSGTIIFGYIIATNVFSSRRIGLFASLIISISCMRLFCVFFNTGKIAGVLLLISCLYLIIKITKIKEISFTILLVITMFPLFFWHPEVSYPLIGFFLASIILSNLFCKSINRNSLNYIFLTFIISYVFYLLFVHEALGTRIIDTFTDTSINTVSLIQNTNYIIGINKLLYILQANYAYIGITLIMFFLVYQIFIWLEKPSELNIFYVLIIVILYLVPFFGFVTGIFNLGAERSLIMVAIISSIFSARQFFELFLFNNKYARLIAILLFLFFVLSSTSSYLVADGNDIFNDQISIGTIYLTDSTLQSINYLSSIDSDKTIITDQGTISRYTNIPKGTRVISPTIFFQNDDYSIDFIHLNVENIVRANWDSNVQSREIMNKTTGYNLVYVNNKNFIYSSKTV